MRGLAFAAEVLARFGRHRAAFLAAGIAYFVFFAAFPLLLGLVVLLGHMLSPEWAERLVLNLVSQGLPVPLTFVREVVEAIAVDRAAVGWIAGLLLLWSGKNAFSSLGDALDAVHETPPLAWKQALMRQGIAILFALGMGGAVAALSGARWTLALVANLVLPLVGLSPGRLSGVISLLDVGAPLALAVLGLLAVYAWLPARPSPPTPRLIGAGGAALGWEATHQLFGYYVGHFAHFSRVYGPLSEPIALLLWIYVSGMLILLGAEVAAVLGDVR